MADGSGAGRRGDLRQAGRIGRQGMVASLTCVSGGSACGEELRAAARKVECIDHRVVGADAPSASEGGCRRVGDVVGLRGGGGAGEGPNGLGVIALEGIDGEHQLRLGLFQRKQGRKR